MCLDHCYCHYNRFSCGEFDPSLLFTLSCPVQVWRWRVQPDADVVDQDEFLVDDVPLWLGHQAKPGTSAGRQDHTRWI